MRGKERVRMDMKGRKGKGGQEGLWLTTGGMPRRSQWSKSKQQVYEPAVGLKPWLCQTTGDS